MIAGQVLASGYWGALRNSPVKSGDWIPGDAGFIENENYVDGDHGTQGENIIYLGKGNYYGHHPGETVRKHPGWMQAVRDMNGGTGAPKDINRRWWPTQGVK